MSLQREYLHGSHAKIISFIFVDCTENKSHVKIKNIDIFFLFLFGNRANCCRWSQFCWCCLSEGLEKRYPATLTGVACCLHWCRNVKASLSSFGQNGTNRTMVGCMLSLLLLFCACPLWRSLAWIDFAILWLSANSLAVFLLLCCKIRFPPQLRGKRWATSSNWLRLKVW